MGNKGHPKALEIKIKKEKKEGYLEKADDILAMYQDIDLTAREYENMKKHNRHLHNSDLYLDYSTIIEAKKRCYEDFQNQVPVLISYRF